MAELPQSSFPPPSILSSSPNIASPVKTLDESLPTAPFRDPAAPSLALSSPIRQNQNHTSFPTKSITQIPNRGESSSSPSDKTIVTPSSFTIEGNQCSNSQILEQTLISPSENNRFLPIASTSRSLDANRDSYNRPPRRHMAGLDYQGDDDHKVESTNAGEIPWSYRKNEPTGVGAGLDNSGNTCFIASVLQCFTHTVSLIESLRSYTYQTPCNCGNEKFCVMQAIRDHIELALRSSGYNLTTDRFRDNLNHFSSDFQINHQEDAHEFLQSFLDKLERCCLDPKSKPGSISGRNVNIVDHVFGGRLMSRLHCCNCNSFSDTFEPSLGWSLEIEDVDNLWSALESFTRVEKLEDQFTCENCKEKVSKEKQLKLDKLPLVATFHLKRFKNDGHTMEKIFKQVDFPLELDLLPYMSSNENPEVSTKYHLYAFVEHLGNGVSFGHYSSYVRSAPETWHNFDDAKVTRISEECVLTQNAYILFYAREGTKWFSTAFEELKPVFEATPLIFSPKSVLETTSREECASDHSYENPNYVCKGSVEVPNLGVNHEDFSCHEAQEEVFHSAESSSDDHDSYMSDAYESPKAADASEKPFADETSSHQEEPNLYPSGNKAIDASKPVVKTQKQDSSPKRKAGERANKQDSLLKRQGSFQIQRSHLETKKKKQEESNSKNLFRSIVAASGEDPKGTKIAFSYLNRNHSSYRSRMLAAALGSYPIKKKKITKPMALHRHL